MAKKPTRKQPELEDEDLLEQSLFEELGEVDQPDDEDDELAKEGVEFVTFDEDGSMNDLSTRGEVNKAIQDNDDLDNLVEYELESEETNEQDQKTASKKKPAKQGSQQKGKQAESETDQGDDSEEEGEVVLTPKAPKTDSRADKRVRESLDKTKRAEALQRAAQQRLILERSQAKEKEIKYSETLVNMLEERKELLITKLKEAKINEDIDQELAYTDKLRDVHSQIQAFQGHINQVKSVDPSDLSSLERSIPVEQPSPAGVPQPAVDWSEGKEFLVDNKAYGALPLDKRKMIMPIRQALRPLVDQLRSEGFDPSEALFYEEADARLAAQFPLYEDIVLYGLDALDSETEDTEESDTPSSRGTQKPRTIQAKQKSVPTKGPTLGGGQSPSAKAKTKVRLTPSQAHFLKTQWLPAGRSIQEYLKFVQEDNDVTVIE